MDARTGAVSELGWEGKTVAYAENDGVRIHYQVEGDGPPLFLHMGFSVDLTGWYEWGYVDALKDDYRLILIDPRGHGKSDKPHDPSAYQSAHRVGDVVAVLDDLGVERTHFLGYSMGGRVGFEVAQLAPSRLRSLAIGGATPHAVVIPAERRSPLLGEGMQGYLDRQPFPDHVKTPTFRAMMLANDAEALVATLIDRPSLEGILPTLPVPCLIYVGDADPRHPESETYVRLIPDATFVSLPGLDHMTGISPSDLVLPHVRTFLDRVTRQQASAG
jgi:pimeloyl-ACP methyl ester carboxylesterase